MTDVIHDRIAADESIEYYVSGPPGAKRSEKVWAVMRRIKGTSHAPLTELLIARRLTHAQATTEARRLNKLEAQDHVHAMPAGTTGPAIEVREGEKEWLVRVDSDDPVPLTHYVVIAAPTRDDAIRRVKGGISAQPASVKPSAKLSSKQLRAKKNPAKEACACSPQSPAPRSAAYEACLAEGAKLGPMRNPRKVYELVAPAMAKEEQETFVVVPLDARYQLRGAPVEVHRGAASSVQVSTQQVLRAVAMSGAASYVVCHNHPSGKCSPSRADQALTKHLEKSTKAVYGQEVLMVDHLIIGRGQYYSFRENKLHKA
jgi:hypothetical protein